MSRMRGLLAILAGLAIIAIFFVLQVWLQRVAPGPLREPLLCLAVLIEFGLLWLVGH
jgi:hypothetical protein